MDMVVVVVVACLAGLLAAVAGASLLAWWSRSGATVRAPEAVVQSLVEQRWEAERQATVRAAVDAAVDTVVKVAGERLGAQAEAGGRELANRQLSFEQRVGELSGALTDQMSLRAAAVDRHMGDVRAELARVSDLVATLQRERAEQHGRVESRLSEVAAVGARLADTTQSLRQALANPAARGQWGERMADDVLRAAGLVEGISYRKQSATAAGTVPDFTFLLPGGRVLHMDVKFPVDNYLRYLEAGSDGERDRLAVAFVRDVRARVRELSGRSYVDPDETLDEVLLFIPNEAVYAFVHQHDRDLVDVALRQKVVLCSPTTLFSVLAVIRQAVEQTRLQRTSDEILACLVAFERQWGKFSEALDKVGRGLDTVRRGWDDLSGTRRRQLERQLELVGQLRSRRDLDRAVAAASPAGAGSSDGSSAGAGEPLPRDHGGGASGPWADEVRCPSTAEVHSLPSSPAAAPPRSAAS
ncbi:MAG TPA: DNA recombination protein RmuC [Acidimicrobiales bacterium]|nr:DNA recombination protein RmuC [Acidimicrobiales bacterium]